MTAFNKLVWKKCENKRMYKHNWRCEMRYLFFPTLCFLIISACASNSGKIHSEERNPPQASSLNRYATNQPANHVKIVIRELDGEKFSGPPSSLKILPGSHTMRIEFVILGADESGYLRSKELRFDSKEGGEYAFGYPSTKPYKLFIYDINTGEKVSY